MREIGPVLARDGQQQREPKPEPEPRARIQSRIPEQLIWLFQGELVGYGRFAAGKCVSAVEFSNSYNTFMKYTLYVSSLVKLEIFSK